MRHHFVKIVLLVLSAILLTACGGAEERKLAHLEKGKQYYEENNLEKARIEFKNVLQIDPKDVEGRYWLARTLENLQNWQKAAGHYLAIVQELDKNHVDAHVRLGQIYLLGNAVDKALEHAEAALKVAPTNPDALALRGGVRGRQDDIDGALEDGLAGLNQDPGHVNSIALLASLYLKQQESEKALKILEQGLERNPGHTGLMTIKTRVHMARQEHGKAEDLLAKIVQQEPDVFAHRLRLAAFQAAQNALDAAEKTLRDAIAHDPSVIARLALADFLLKKRDAAAAERELLAFIAKDPDESGLRFALAKLYELNKEPEKSQAVYQEIIAKKGVEPDGLKARVNLAQSYVTNNKVDAAATLIEEVLAENASDREALMLRGQIAMSKNDAAAAIADFRAALRDDPNSPKGLALLARAHYQNKEVTLARDTMKKAVDAHPNNPQLRAGYVELLVRAGDTETAITEVNEILKISPNNQAALEMLFRLQSAKKDWKAALATAATLKEEFADNPIGYYLSGLVHQAEQKLTDSIEEFGKALEKSPDAIQPLSQMVKSYLAQGKAEDALAKLEGTLKNNPENYVAYNLKGEILFGLKRFPEAKGAFAKAIEIKPDWHIPYARLANVHFQEKDIPGAVKAFEQGLKAIPDNPVLATGLAMLYEKENQQDKAIAVYDSLLARHPDSQLAANNLAMLLVDHSEKDETRLQRAATLIEPLKTSDNAAFLDTVGWVQYHQGDFDVAIQNLQKAVDAAPQAPELHYHLGMAYLGKGDTASARNYLKQAVNAKTEFRGLDKAKEALKNL